MRKPILVALLMSVLVIGASVWAVVSVRKEKARQAAQPQHEIVITGMKPGTQLSVDLTPGKPPKVSSDTDTVRWKVREMPKEEAKPKAGTPAKPKADAEASP